MNRKGIEVIINFQSFQRCTCEGAGHSAISQLELLEQLLQIGAILRRNFQTP